MHAMDTRFAVVEWPSRLGDPVIGPAPQEALATSVQGCQLMDCIGNEFSDRVSVGTSR